MIGKDGHDSSEQVMNTFFVNWSLLLIPTTFIAVVLLIVSFAVTLGVFRTEVEVRRMGRQLVEELLSTD